MPLVSDIWHAYIVEYAEPTIVNVRETKRYWGRLQVLAECDAETLDMDDYIRDRKQAGAQPGTINRELGTLRAALRWAERKRRITKAPIIRNLPKPPPKMLVCTREQCSALIREADKQRYWRARVFIRIMLASGQRPGAVADMRWSAIDKEVVDFRPIHKLAARMKKRSVVPINPLMRDALRIASAYRREDSDYVIHYAGRKVTHLGKIMHRVAVGAKMPWVSPHVLRHSVVSILLQEKHSLLEVSRLIGHANTKITEEVYFQHPASWLKDVADALTF